MKILFIDEDWEIEVLAKVLSARHAEHFFDLADRLQDAKTKLWKEKYDRIVLDIMLPADEVTVPHSSEQAGVVSGLLFYDIIRSDKSCPNKETPIIVLTGLLPGAHPRVRAIQQEIGNCFVQKPVHPDALYAKLLNPAK